MMLQPATPAMEDWLTPDLLAPSLEASVMRNAVRQRLFGGSAAPSQLDRFVVLSRIGSGGMGVVFEAYDPTLERKIGLKVLDSTSAGPGPDARERLLREARALAKLSHPNVVSVFDVGESGDDIFIAMELIRGQTLQEFVRRPGLTTSRLVGIYVQAARGLAAAHQVGLVHRDFKPSNALVGVDGRVRVLDFGLARQHDVPTLRGAGELGPIASPTESLTRTGARVGTPAYMAPEQYAGLPCTPATDQYSLCLSLCEALIGARPPRRGGELRPEALQACPRALRPVLARGLATEPDQRWSSMAVLVDRLEAVVHRKRRGFVALGLVGVGALAVAASLSRESPCAQLPGAWEPSQRDVARAALVEADPELASAAVTALDDYAEQWRTTQLEACVDHHERRESSSELFDRAMLCLDRRRVALGGLVEQVQGLDGRAAARVLDAVSSLPSVAPCGDAERLLAEHPPPADPAVAAAVVEIQRQLDQASTRSRLGDFEGAERLAALGDVRARTLEYRPIQARAALFIGTSERTRGQLEAATRRLEDALWLAEAGGDDELVALTSAELVATLALQGRAVDVEARARRTEAAIERLGRRTLADMVLSDARGILAHVEGRLEDAQRHYTEALAHAEALPDVPASTVGDRLDKLASIHVALGERERADELLARARTLKEDSLGPLHPSVLATRFHIASSAVERGALDEALSGLHAVLSDAERSMGEDSTLVGVIHGNLAIAYTRARRGSEAIEHGERSVAALRRSLGDRNAQLITPLMNLAETYADFGSPDQAYATLEEALSLGRALLGDGADLGAVLLSLAKLDLAQGDAVRAEQRALEGVGLLERALGRPVHAEISRGYQLLGRARRAQGEVSTAEAALRKALSSAPPGSSEHGDAARALTELGR